MHSSLTIQEGVLWCYSLSRVPIRSSPGLMASLPQTPREYASSYHSILLSCCGPKTSITVASPLNNLKGNGGANADDTPLKRTPTYMYTVCSMAWLDFFGCKGSETSFSLLGTTRYQIFHKAVIKKCGCNLCSCKNSLHLRKHLCFDLYLIATSNAKFECVIFKVWTIFVSSILLIKIRSQWFSHICGCTLRQLATNYLEEKNVQSPLLPLWEASFYSPFPYYYK